MQPRQTRDRGSPEELSARPALLASGRASTPHAPRSALGACGCWRSTPWLRGGALAEDFVWACRRCLAALVRPLEEVEAYRAALALKGDDVRLWINIGVAYSHESVDDVRAHY